MLGSVFQSLSAFRTEGHDRVDDSERKVKQIGSPARPKPLDASRQRRTSVADSEQQLLKDIVPGALMAVGDTADVLGKARRLSRELEAASPNTLTAQRDTASQGLVTGVPELTGSRNKVSDSTSPAEERFRLENRGESVGPQPCTPRAKEATTGMRGIESAHKVSEEIVRRFTFEFSNQGRCRRRIEMPSGPSRTSSPTPPPSLRSDDSMGRSQSPIKICAVSPCQTAQCRSPALSSTTLDSEAHCHASDVQDLDRSRDTEESETPMHTARSQQPLLSARSDQSGSTTVAAGSVNSPLKGQLFLDGLELFRPDPAIRMSRCRCKRTRSVDPKMFCESIPESAESLTKAVEVCVDCGKTKLFCL